MMLGRMGITRPGACPGPMALSLRYQSAILLMAPPSWVQPARLQPGAFR